MFTCCFTLDVYHKASRQHHDEDHTESYRPRNNCRNIRYLSFSTVVVPFSKNGTYDVSNIFFR